MIDKKIMNDLARFEFWVDGESFEKTYCKSGGSEDLAKHLWNKFVGYEHSVLRLWSALDTKNCEIMVKVIKEWLKENQK